MRLRKFALLAGGTALLSALLIPIAPAFAVDSCSSGIFPKSAGGQSGLKVACSFDARTVPTLSVGRIEMHDATNAAWHRGAARKVTIDVVAKGSTTLSAAITNVQTLIPVTDRTSFPQTGTFVIQVELEQMNVTGGAGAGAGSFTVTRAFGGSVAAAHAISKPVTEATGRIAFAANSLDQSDLRRPIAAWHPDNTSALGGGAFIQILRPTACTFATCTEATLSTPNSGVAETGISATIEHTSARVLFNAKCTATAASNLTSPTALFMAGDVGKSVSGGPFKVGSRITAFVNTTTVTVDNDPVTAGVQGPPAACTYPDVITLGAATFSPAATATVPSFPADKNTRQYTNQAAQTTALTANVTAVQTNIPVGTRSNFPSSGSVVIQVQAEQMNVTGFGAAPIGGGIGTYTVTRGFNGTTAAPHNVGSVSGVVTLVTPAPVASFSCNGTGTITSTLAGAGFGAADIHLKVTMLPGNTTSTIATQAGTTAVLTSPDVCPSTTTTIVIGEASGGSPGEASMGLLGATINLNPSLVATQDDCGTPPTGGTFDGFGVVSKWEDPGSYGSGLGSPPPTSNGQVLFPTSVLSFAGYVVGQPTGDGTQAGGHYDFVFPNLPTTLALCPGTPNTITLGFQPTVLSAAKSLPTGSGNPSSPSIRAIGPQTGTFGQKIVLKSGAAHVIATLSPAGCAIAAANTPGATALACGDG